MFVLHLKDRGGKKGRMTETFHSVKYLWSSSSVTVRKLLTPFTGSPSAIETHYNREDKSKNPIYM